MCPWIPPCRLPPRSPLAGVRPELGLGLRFTRHCKGGGCCSHLSQVGHLPTPLPRDLRRILGQPSGLLRSVPLFFLLDKVRPETDVPPRVVPQRTRHLARWPVGAGTEVYNQWIQRLHGTARASRQGTCCRQCSQLRRRRCYSSSRRRRYAASTLRSISPVARSVSLPHTYRIRQRTRADVFGLNHRWTL